MGKAGKAATAARGARVAGTIFVVLLKALAVALAIATPLLGVWVSSSLAAYANGPIWLAIVAGLLLFPVLPLGWEGLSTWRRKRKKVVKERVLTFWDRLVIRTLFLNLLFLTVLLAARPEVGFTAVQTRGDWMIEGVSTGWADSTRRGMFAVADRLEWLYLYAHEDEFAQEGGDDEGPDPAADELPEPSPSPSGVADGGPTKGCPAFDHDGWAEDRAGGSSSKGADAGAPSKRGVADAGAGGGDAARPPTKRPEKAPTGRVPSWPVAPVLHPVVAGIPRSAEKSIDTVASYISERVPDTYGRVRAIHDWVADNIVYDVPSYNARRYPPQDAETTFRTRKSVCAGYANLVVALGKRMDVRVVFVSGDSRDNNGNVGGLGHAWNAVRLGGTWYLLDATWDAGSVDGDTFTKSFRTDYFLTPPEVFGLDHFPRNEAWQLRRTPISRGDFMRQPMLTPAFFVKRLRMLEPDRSQVTVRDRVRVRVDNPAGYYMLASYHTEEAREGRGARCQVNQGRVVTVGCRFPSSGRYRVKVFAARQQYGSYPYVGQVLVNSSQ